MQTKISVQKAKHISRGSNVVVSQLNILNFNRQHGIEIQAI